MTAEPLGEPPEADEFEWEIVELVDEYGTERAALRATYQMLKAVLADADRAVSRGFVRGLFSQGARPARNADDLAKGRGGAQRPQPDPPASG
ncbi:hypothetical protein [Bosea sp. TAF32]|uniref:hypothetical protein n=1 Tax=Bosea sp. TAF32 TaxID=3237482 RepID=UPI003F918E5E